MDSQIKGNEGEEFVNNLANSTFFNYWCYPNPKYENGNKKEICDLLVLFNDICIIFSVKNYEFKGNHFRYFNNTLNKAIKQIKGACNTLFSEKEIIIKHPKKEINEIFPKDNIKKTFRIIVNLGENVKFYPFNLVTNNNDFVTIFDKISFETILKELDTLPDFIDYLEKREILFKEKFTIVLPGDEDDFSIETQNEFFLLADQAFETDSKTILLSGSEKDLLAHFFENKREFPKILKDETVNGFYLVLDGKWEEFAKKKQFESKKKADKVSYFIDLFVENELMKNVNPTREKIAKYLLSFDRLSRRSIAESYYDFYEKNALNKGLFFGRRLGNFGKIGILFTSYTEEMTEIMINTLNQLAIESFNLYTNYRHEAIVLISTNKNHHFRFAIVEDIIPYSKEYENLIRNDIKTLGWFTNITEEKFINKEYPD